MHAREIGKMKEMVDKSQMKLKKKNDSKVNQTDLVQSCEELGNDDSKMLETAEWENQHIFFRYKFCVFRICHSRSLETFYRIP